MPTGKVKWYDADKGFGFLSQEDGEDVYVRSSALPEGVEDLKAGQKVEFGLASGRRGPQALSVTLIDAPPSLTRTRREAAACRWLGLGNSPARRGIMTVTGPPSESPFTE